MRETDADGKTKVGMLAKAQRGVRAAAQRAISDSNTEAGMRAEVRETDADGKTEVGMLQKHREVCGRQHREVCEQRHREVCGLRHREQLPMTARKGVREGHGERMPTAAQRRG